MPRGGLADFTFDRLVAKIDKVVTEIKATRGDTPEKAKVPVAYKTDREAIFSTEVAIFLSTRSQNRVCFSESI